jgi:hypothetical protein
MKRLTDLKLVVRLGRRVGGIRAGSTGHVYGLSGLGQAIVAAEALSLKSRRRVWETSPSHTDHLLAVADVYIAATEAERRGEVELLEFQAEPPCWRRFAGVGGQAITLKPDAFVRIGIGDVEVSAFVEVDLATESTPTLLRKSQVYIQYWRSGVEQHQHDVFPRVLWATPAARRVAQIEQTLRRLPADARPLFQVALLDDWQSALTLGGGDAA